MAKRKENYFPLLLLHIISLANPAVSITHIYDHPVSVGQESSTASLGPLLQHISQACHPDVR